MPTIVESAVASPAAASAAASQIRKFLSKENYDKPHVQYNAVMLIRILADNPGPSFTKNMDKHFADTVKHLLRHGQDPSVAQILRETLDSLHREKAYDTNLSALFTMWKKETILMANAAKTFGPRTMNAPPWNSAQQPGAYGPGAAKAGKGLPPPVELAGRIEEARTSAKLLLQLVQSTPPNELLGNDLIKEFSERCMSAQRSVQTYINCDSPPPDDDTMLTLIETNEQLSLAASKHQRAVLQARRLQGPTPSPPGVAALGPTPPPVQGGPYGAPLHIPPVRSEPAYFPTNSFSTREEPPSAAKNDPLPLPPSLQAGPGGQRSGSGPSADDDDPFADHHAPVTYGAPPSGPPPLPNRSSNGHGAESTPSYLDRQESAAGGLTMHGARATPLGGPDEYVGSYSDNNAPNPYSQTRQQGGDVSPVAERAPVTYRY